MTIKALAGRKLYAFGDSLVKGHTLKVGMLDAAAAHEGMILEKYAENGATIMPTEPGDHSYASDNRITDVAQQITSAPVETPALICFDGLVNDASIGVRLSPLGHLTADFNDDYNLTTPYGAFEHVCAQLRQKYPHTQVLYIANHHIANNPLALQDQMHDLAIDVCQKWAIDVVDVYCEGGINTNIPQMAADYSYNGEGSDRDGDGTHLNVIGYETWYAPMIEAAIERHFS